MINQHMYSVREKRIEIRDSRLLTIKKGITKLSIGSTESLFVHVVNKTYIKITVQFIPNSDPKKICHKYILYAY